MIEITISAMTVEVEVSIMEDHREIRDIPLVCPDCKASLTADGSVEQYQEIPARRRGRFELDTRTGEAVFVEDVIQDRWHQTDDLDLCPAAHYACRECDRILTDPTTCTC